MAGNTVTLEFAGDEKKLTQSMANVGTAATKMSSTVGNASDGFKRTSRSAEDWAEKTDTVDTRAMGFRDTLTGLQDSFTGLTQPGASLSDRLLTLGMGVGDLASGFTNFLIPQMAAFWTWLTSTTAATWAVSAAKTAWAAITKGVTLAMQFLNNAIKANPILFLVGLIIVLVTAFATLWAHSEGFRKFFTNMWNGFKNTVATVVKSIKAAWDGVVDFFGHFPDRIGKALAGLGGLLKGIFVGAVNGVISGINWFLDHSINWLLDRVNDVSGLIGIPPIPHIPHIPTLSMHIGGIVPGDPGTEVLTVLKAGEHVTGDGGGSVGGALEFRGDTDSALAQVLMKLARMGLLQWVST